jgi:phospholipid/cholesterol/gamma-HCH transport system permease protein
MQAAFDWREEGDGAVLALSGDWTVQTVAGVDAPLRALEAGDRVTLDLSALGRMDVAGAWLVMRTLGGPPQAVRGDHPSAQRLIAVTQAAATGELERPSQLAGLYAIYDRIGRAVTELSRETMHTLAFLGQSMAVLGRLVLNPSRIRWVSTVSVMESAGLNAMPIVMMLSFFVGVVVAFLGSRILGDFGVSVFTVELVAFSVLRELGVVITAILLAGRTCSAFTAQIGAMKMRQELDAMRVLGLDPMEAIVAPRLIAMLVMTPVLTFAATMAGLLGGLIICWAMLNISPALFITRIQDGVPIQHFWVGMVKTPVLAVVLAITGCRHGLETGVDVTSLGRRVTASVVQAIFLVIVIDALFAVWFLEMDW